MGFITGSDAKIGMKVATTFGTAVACAASDKMEVESLVVSENVEELTAMPIGSGDIMTNESQRGADSPTAEITKIQHYNDAGCVGIAQMFGGASVTTLVAATAYCHSILVNETLNQKWLTAAFQAISANPGSIEFPSAAVRKAVITTEAPPNYAKAALSLIANKYQISGNTNTNSSLESVTLADTERVVVGRDSEFLINTQSSGALTTVTDRKVIQSAVLEINRPQEHSREIKGTTGNSEPVPASDVPLQATLTVTFRNLDDFTWITAHQAGTEYKANLTILGSLISGSTYKTFQWNLPRLKVVSSPQWGFSSPGNNPLTVVFKALVAPAAPTGMISTYPYFRIINTRSAAFLT